MRIYDDLRKSVVFFGFEDAAKPAGINCVGTGFLLLHEGLGYLVTARHLTHQLRSDPSQPKSDPFLLRINKTDGSAENVHADEIEWFEATDPTVDLALVAVHIPPAAGFDVSYLDFVKFALDAPAIERERIGVANLTYTLGLFRLLSGEKRNLPICHVGSIALMPGNEKIPIWDWTDPEPSLSERRRLFVEGYLVEAQSISGLSGSPVFVRVEEIMEFGPLLFGRYDGSRLDPMALYTNRVRLSGIWQGAWEAPPDEVKSAQAGTTTVPVGMGVVVPCTQLLDLLDRPDVKAQRLHLRAQREALGSAMAIKDRIVRA